MDKYAISSTMKAKPGKDAKAKPVLVEEALPLTREGPETTRFLVLRAEPGAFAIFDTFADEAAVQVRLDGPVPKLVAERAPALFEGPLAILRSDVFAVKQRPPPSAAPAAPRTRRGRRTGHGRFPQASGRITRCLRRPRAPDRRSPFLRTRAS